jgi:hypothetical protein
MHQAENKTQYICHFTFRYMRMIFLQLIIQAFGLRRALIAHFYGRLNLDQIYSSENSTSSRTLLLVHVTHRYRPVFPLIILMEPGRSWCTSLMTVSCDVNTCGSFVLNTRLRNSFDIFFYQNVISLRSKQFEFYDWLYRYLCNRNIAARFVVALDTSPGFL